MNDSLLDAYVARKAPRPTTATADVRPSALSVGGVLALCGAVVALVGSLLPWSTSPSDGVQAIDPTLHPLSAGMASSWPYAGVGHGWWTIGMLVVLGWTLWTVSRQLWWATAGTGVGIALLGLVAMHTVDGAIGDFNTLLGGISDSTLSPVGATLVPWLILCGGALVTIGAVTRALRDASRT